jgi:hypothetical protein
MHTLNVPIIRRAYILYAELHSLTPNVPKISRHTLWQRTLVCCLDLLQGLIGVGNQPSNQRATRLAQQSELLELLRILIRLSLDTKIVSQKVYLNLQLHIDEIGRMLGGWLKSISRENK